MQFARINGISLHFADEGPREAPAIVFANSLGTDFRIWDDVAAAFAGRMRVIRYDKRGHGLSDAPPAPYAMADHVGDIEALLAHLQVSRAVLVGVSVGGMIVTGLAASRPDLVCGLVLCDTAHKIGTAEMWNARIAAIEGGGIPSISDAILQRWFAPDYRENEAVAFSAYRNMLERTPLPGYSGTCAALRDADYTGEAAGLSMPVLLLVGSHDGSTPPDLVRTTHELIPGSRFEIIEGAGHLPCIEKPGETAQLIAQFMKENAIG